MSAKSSVAVTLRTMLGGIIIPAASTFVTSVMAMRRSRPVAGAGALKKGLPPLAN